MTPDEFSAAYIAAIRGMLGTPWHHQGRCPGVGLDCIGLIVCAMRAVGVSVDEPVVDYPRKMHIGLVTEALMRHGYSPVSVAQMGACDVVILNIEGSPQHAGVITQGRPSEVKYVHVPAIAGRKCVEEVMSDSTIATIYSAWRMPQLGGAHG